MYKYLLFLLFLFSFSYYIIVIIRNYLYDKGIIISKKFRTPIICIGNLSTGGTGKTPHTEFLIQIFNDKKITILSRGYKRKTKGFLIANQDSKIEDIGDEPFQIFQKFRNKITLVVCENRIEAVNKIEKMIKPDLIILDDGFQHRSLNASINIVLTDYNKLFFKDYVLPLGTLREQRNGIKRADIVIVTKSPELNSEEKIKIKEKINQYKRVSVYFSKIRYSLMLNNFNKKIDIDCLKNKNVLLVTGISNTNSLENFLKEKSINFFHKKYKDHYNFSNKDIYEIENEFNKGKYNCILTTEKDFVRLKDKINKEKLYFLPISIDILEEDKFKKEIYETL